MPSDPDRSYCRSGPSAGFSALRDRRHPRKPTHWVVAARFRAHRAGISPFASLPYAKIARQRRVAPGPGLGTAAYLLPSGRSEQTESWRGLGKASTFADQTPISVTVTADWQKVSLTVPKAAAGTTNGGGRSFSKNGTL